MTNNILFDFLLKYDNLSELSYSNNKLTYQDKTIDTRNVYLNDFFSNQYNQLNLDQYTISAKDFFNIIEIHSKIIEPENSINEVQVSELERFALSILEKAGKTIKNNKVNNYDVINCDHYFNLLNNNELSEDDLKKLIDYETYINQLNTYNNYLLPNQNNELNKYKANIIDLIEKQNTDNILNDNQLNAIKQYNDMTNKIANNNLVSNNKLVKKANSEISAGFINAFIVILLMLSSGIVIGTIVYFTIII